MPEQDNSKQTNKKTKTRKENKANQKTENEDDKNRKKWTLKGKNKPNKKL